MQLHRNLKWVPERGRERETICTRVHRAVVSCQGKNNWGITCYWQIEKQPRRSHSMSKTSGFKQIRRWNSSSKWPLYSGAATNSSPCKKHGGGAVPSIIHLEIDRCVSPGTPVWIVRCSAFRRDLLWSLPVNLWVWRSGSEFNMKRSDAVHPYFLL